MIDAITLAALTTLCIYAAIIGFIVGFNVYTFFIEALAGPLWRVYYRAKG